MTISYAAIALVYSMLSIGVNLSFFASLKLFNNWSFTLLSKRIARVSRCAGLNLDIIERKVRVAFLAA